MDINFVELKGRVSSDVVRRKKHDSEDDWLTFSVAMNEYRSSDTNKAKSVPVYISISVFNPTLVKKLLGVGLRQGSHIWLTGKLFVQSKENRGVTQTYTSVIANDAEVFITKSIKREVPIVPTPPIDKEDIETPF